MKSTVISFFLFSALFAASAQAGEYTQLKIKDFQVSAEVADNDAERMKGLMFRESLGENNGMLFVMERNDYICMWMQNTLIPLSVAFINEKAQIINIERMKPQTKDLHCSKGPARFALEMNSDWFQTRGIRAGDRVEHLPPAADKN